MSDKTPVMNNLIFGIRSQAFIPGQWKTCQELSKFDYFAWSSRDVRNN